MSAIPAAADIRSPRRLAKPTIRIPNISEQPSRSPAARGTSGSGHAGRTPRRGALSHLAAVWTWWRGSRCYVASMSRAGIFRKIFLGNRERMGRRHGNGETGRVVEYGVGGMTSPFQPEGDFSSGSRRRAADVSAGPRSRSRSTKSRSSRPGRTR
jgi:hypothetical protein